MVAAVAAALDRLEIVSLRCIYAAETRTGTGNIHYQAGKLHCRHIGYSLHF